MYTYNFTQWMAFFILYCFVGWCWESCYVSVKKRKWVNRGFMHGPLLPIYGSGAVIMLFVSLPLKQSPVAVYFAGMVAATLLEYVTGVAMEALFKVRYWDYSNQKFNFQGHICLTSSLAWGFFSVALVYWVHKPFEKFVLAIPMSVLSPLTHLILAFAAADFALSFKTAIELRDVLVKLEKAKEELRLMQRRIEVIEAVLADEVQQKKERKKQQFAELKEEGRQQLAELKEEGRQQLAELTAEKKQELTELTAEKKQQLTEELSQLRRRIAQNMAGDRELSYFTKDKRSLLRRNPGATSRKYVLAFEEFRCETWPELKAEFKAELKERKEKLEEKIEEKIQNIK